MRNKKKTMTAEQLATAEETKRLQDLFCKHAFLFLRNADTILADPQMAYCIAPFQNGTAQTGAFPCHTLGVYLEWWLSGNLATHIAEDGRQALIYKFAGSLLSGVNICYRVFEDGTTERFSCKALINLCRSFSPISKRYSDRRDEVVPYSLDEVIELILKA